MTPAEILRHCEEFEEAWAPDDPGGLRNRVLPKWVLGTDYGRFVVKGSGSHDPEVVNALKEIALISWLESRAALEGKQ